MNLPVGGIKESARSSVQAGLEKYFYLLTISVILKKYHNKSTKAYLPKMYKIVIK